jgi:hypothetical protein
MAKTLNIKKGNRRRRITMRKKHFWNSGRSRDHWGFFDELGEEILDLIYLDYIFGIFENAGDFDEYYEYDAESDVGFPEDMFENVAADTTSQIDDMVETTKDSPVFETRPQQDYTPPVREQYEEPTYEPDPEPSRYSGGFESDFSSSDSGGYDSGGFDD